MAYRAKGLYTKRQRDGLESFIESYCKVVNDPETGPATKQLVEAVFQPWMMFVQCALFMDNCEIIAKVIRGRPRSAGAENTAIRSVN